MGVPKFFRYISERYPCLSELAREHSIPEFDNLYLDMNGIVHNCSHPDDNNIHFHLEETQIFQDIYNYIDKLFYLIKPQKLFFLAVDGVAPRAKMNQQRSRRFRSAREAEQLEAKALQRGEKRQHERFDSNCITPGTEFMHRLQKGLRFFLRTKVSTDPLWQKCRIILSGQETPGEGEHKIMDYIRFMKSQPTFNPNTRHCLYGLDADLIILGLCTHELHFVVLREEVKFGRNVKRTSVEETRFFLLHLGLLREYLELEFDQLSTPTQKLDITQLIDDWVLMGFLVGNDFVPHLPCLHISSNALPLLYKTYMNIYPQLGGNINEHGKLNLGRLERFMQALSEVELQLFEEHSDDLKYMNGKNEAFDVDAAELKKNPQTYDEDLAALIGNSMKLYDGDSDEDLSDEGASLRNEFQNYKRNYYRNKFKNEQHGELIAELSHHYVTALQWVLDYYYRGVQSWDWYYPYHYAPFISDLGNIKDIQVNFSIGRPFLPFQQLLAVLPAASSSLLPPVYHHLMLEEKSPLAEFYPTEFETDLNGKKHDWEAVVLIPFIDEKRLLSAMSPCDLLLNKEELLRNSHGPMFQYDYTVASQGPLDGVPPLKMLKHTHCTELALWSREIKLDQLETVCVELPNAARHVFFPGFPTMKHLEFTFMLCHDRIKVFEQPSRNQSMILLPKKRTLADTVAAVAGKYLEQQVFIGWPHLIKAKVVGVATRDEMVDSSGARPNEPRSYETDCKSLEEHFTGRMGIKFDNLHVLVYIRTYAGSSVDFGSRGNIIMRDSWSTTITPYPAQGVVADIKVQENRRKHFKKIEQLFPAGSTVYFIGNLYAGSEGTVVDPMLVYNNGRIQVNLSVTPPMEVWPARTLQNRRDRDYTNAYKVCRELEISTKCLGRLTGTVWVVLGPRRERMENVSKHNIGLQLKYPRLNEERAGYCRRINNQWFYSTLAIELMACYCERYPAIVDFFASSSDRGEFVYEQDIFPHDMGQHHIEDVANWVRQQPHMKVDRITCGSRTVCKETVEVLINAVEELQAKPVKNVKLQVKPHLLVKPNVTLPDVYRRPGTVRLFDRVVVVRTIYMIPVGTTGTVIGEHPVSDPNPVRLECLNSVETFCEILFDNCIPNCGDIHGIAHERVYKVPESALVIISANDNNENYDPSDLGQQQQEPTPQQSPQHQQSHHLKNRTEAMRRDWREQQQQEPRFVTAASSKYNSITMNTRIADEFFMPSSAPGIKILTRPNANTKGSASGSASASASGSAPATSSGAVPRAAPAASTGAIKKEPPPVLNWRTLSAQAPVQRTAPTAAAAALPLDLALPRNKGGGGGVGGNAPSASILDGPSTSAAAAAAAAAAAVAAAAGAAAASTGASTPAEQTQALKLLLGLKPPSPNSQSTQTPTQFAFQQQPQMQQQQQQQLPPKQSQQSQTQQPSQSQMTQTQLLAQTLAQSLSMALANIPSASQPLQQQQQPKQQQQQQQQQQQPLPPLAPLAPLPSQMPKLPQPPLFWQREAQQQQAKLQSELLLTQQWDQRTVHPAQLLGDLDGFDEMAAGPHTEITQPDRTQAQLPMQLHPYAEQLPQQFPQQFVQRLPQQFPQQLAHQFPPQVAQPTPQFPQQYGMPHGLPGYNNSYQRYNNNGFNYYPTNSNYNNGNNNSNNRSNQAIYDMGNYDSGNYGGPQLAANSNPRRAYTTIQDFVPIQAYRPKKTRGGNQTYAGVVKQPMDKQETGGGNGAGTGAGTGTGAGGGGGGGEDFQQTRRSSVSAPQKTGDEASSELMRTLKIAPTNTEAGSTSANAAKTEEETAGAKPKVVRKPRVPRIGAKFDLDYIMP